MCGRFALSVTPEALVNFIGLVELFAFQPRFNIAPTQQVLVVQEDADGRRATMMRWGLVPAWAPDMKGSPLINARVESVSEKPAFRDALRHRRCLIPATGFYEWQARGNRREPYYFAPPDGGLLLFAGLWERWHAPTPDLFGHTSCVESCTVLTTSANTDVAPIHHRMPVLLGPAHWQRWLADTQGDHSDLHVMLAPAPPGSLSCRPVSQRVNSPRHDDLSCLDPAVDSSANGRPN